jgi:hypothetical protein
MTEQRTPAQAQRAMARAAARMMALRARQILSDAEKLLDAVDDVEGREVAHEAGEATTSLIATTYDGQAKAFACTR